MKPKHFLQIGMRYTSGCDPMQKIWDRDRKIARYAFGIKIKATRLIFLPASKFYEAEVHLTMRSCLKDDVINSAPIIGKYINKLELYRQCPTRRVKDTKMFDVENTSCVRNFMRVTPVSVIEREPWGAASIIRGVNYGVYICTCSVRSDEYKCKKKR